MATTAPARSDSPTNLRHEEAAWRASSYIVNQADEEIRLGRP